MILDEFDSLLVEIFNKEGQPIIIADTGNYRGGIGAIYYINIGGGRIQLGPYQSLEDLAQAVNYEVLARHNKSLHSTTEQDSEENQGRTG